MHYNEFVHHLFLHKDLDEYLKRIGINSKPEKLYGDIFKEKAKDPKFNEILNNTINNFLDVK